MYRNFFKPVFDFLFAFLALIVFSPLLLVISIICFLNFKGRIFFKQYRIGLNEKQFLIYKFITMHPATGKYLNKSDAERLTKTGIFLRVTSLDELPQLFNILMGQMSWIGPRPLLPQYLPHYYPEEKKRHTMRPGITGLAQISGRNVLGWDEKLKLDVWYVEHVSFISDSKIVLATLKQIIRRKNVVADPGSILLPLDEVRKKGNPIG